MSDDESRAELVEETGAGLRGFPGQRVEVAIEDLHRDQFAEAMAQLNAAVA